MRANRFRKYGGIIILLLFLVAFIPSALSQAEKTADRGTGASVGARTADSAPGGKIAGGIGRGTIAMGTAIAEAAVIAVAASQPNSGNPTTVQ